MSENPLRGYVYYSNLAIEMGVIITAGVLGGVKLDKYWNTSPIFTLVCSLAAIAIAMYLILKDFLFSNKNKKNAKKDTH